MTTVIIPDQSHYWKSKGTMRRPGLPALPFAALGLVSRLKEAGAQLGEERLPLLERGLTCSQESLGS